MRKLVIGCLTVFMLGGALNGGALAQFGTPAIDGSISPAEYGTHVNGQNQETSGGQVWYMTWDATNLYVGLTGASTAEGAVLYLDAGPLAPINGGTNADGTITGFAYDNTNFSDLQFRADLVVYVKDGYREYRTADGANGWSGPTAGFGAYASTAGTDREVAIPWSAVGGIPPAFAWFGYVTSAGGFVYGQLPAENGFDLIGLAAREERYYGVGATGDGTSTLPFSRNSYVFNRAADAPGFGAVSVYDFTINSSGRTITRAAGGGAPWTVAGTMRIADGTIDFGTSTTAAAVAGDITIGAAGTLTLSGAAGGDLTVGGNWTRTAGGTLVPNAGTVTFNGTGAQTLSGATQFGDLLVNNAGGGLILSDNFSVTGLLTLTAGVVTTGANTLSLGAAAGAVQTGGHVNGDLEKAFSAGTQNFVFPVGDATLFAPVALANFDVTTPGTVTARATGGGDHPAIAASGIDPAKSVNRYWTLTPGGGLGFTSYDPTFTFVPGDLDGGANTAAFLVRRYDGALWNGTTTGAQTPTSTAAVGVTSFSDFAVGEQLTFTITASASAGGTITPSGSVTVAAGTDTTFAIVPDAGYHTDSVVVDGVNQGAIASFPFAVVDSNHTIAAYFSINTYTITASASSGGTITPSGSVTVVEGNDTTFSIVPGVGYHTDSVVVDGVNQGAIASFPFTAVDSNHTINAYFSIDTFAIVATAVGSGSIAPSGSVVVSYGDNPLFTVTPDPGYHADSVVVDGVNQGAVPSFTFTAVDSNHAITAYFSVNIYTITASAVGNGTIAPSGAVSVTHGLDTTFVITPALNHHIDSVLVDGVNQGAVASFPFTAVDSSHTITAYFSIDTFTITASASSGGTITPSGAVAVLAGTDTTFTITPGIGYHTDSVVVDGVNQGAIASFPFTAVDSNHTIDAYFSIDTFTIVATAVGNGSIAPSGSVVVSYGDNPLFTVTADPGYHVDSVVVDGVNQGAVPSFTFTAVDSGHAITAYFSINVYTISASVIGNGAIVPSGAVSVPHGSDTTFVITPALNHHTDSVVVDGVNQGAIASFPFTAVDSSHTITAYFSIDTYTITASASSGGIITPSGAVSVAAGTDTTFTITPDPGSHVDSVVVDGVNVGTPSTYPFTAVLANHTIATYFSVDSYFILASAVGGGTISPADTILVVYGATPAFTITPDTGYHCDSVVVDGVNLGPLSLYTFAPIDSSHTITAYFSIDTYLIVATAFGGGSVIPADSVIVPYGANQAFVVAPNTGYHTDSVVVDGVNLGILPGYTFPAVDSNHTITAYFSINHYTITAAAVGSGTIAPAGTIVLPFGTNQTFTVLPDTGYHVDSLVVDGVNQGSLVTWTFTGVAANHTITAYISINGYIITATATAGGTITPSGAVNALYGSSQAFAIAPGIGRHIDSVVVDGVNQGVITSYSFVNITANHTIRAYFSIDLFTIIATADSHGTISPSGSIPAAYGSSRTFTITARRGYGVLDVLVDSVSVGPVTSYTFTNITTNHRIDVSFKQVNVFLTITPDSILARDPATSKYRKPAKRYRGIPPNWTNLLSEVVYQGGFQPGATESDAAGGMRVGVSYMTWVAPYKWKPVRDSARTMAWLRLTKWDAKKNVGKTYTALQKTLEDRTGQHEGDPRGFDYLGSPEHPGRLLVNQLTLLPPKKHNNMLLAELVALKVNIAASQLDKTPLGFGELLYENDGHFCDGMSIVRISASADTALTRWEGVEDSVYEQLYEAIYDINRAFLGPIDTVFFNDGGQLILDGEVDVADVPFLWRDTTVVARRLARTSDLTEGEEDYDDPEFEDGAPIAAKLYQNYPNPFNPATTVNFRLREPSVVTITVYNLLGQAVATLARSEEMDEGYQTLEFVADGLASGVYFCRIDVQGMDDAALRSVVTNKMLLLK